MAHKIIVPIRRKERPIICGKDYETIWCEAFGLSSGATRIEIEAAYQEKMKGLYLAREEGLEWARQNIKDGSKEPWYDVLSVSQEATTAAKINAAYMKKIKQYHPDRVSGLGEKLRLVAEIETKKLNAAREEGLDWIRRDEDISDEEKDEPFESEGEYEEEYNETWYLVLGVLPDATSDEIEAAYYSMMEYFQNALRLAEACHG